MGREAIAYMLFISSALYLKERNLKPFHQEALYIHCKRWHLLHRKVTSNDTKDGIFYIERWHLMIQKMASFTAKDATFCISPLIDADERNK